MCNHAQLLTNARKDPSKPLGIYNDGSKQQYCEWHFNTECMSYLLESYVLLRRDQDFLSMAIFKRNNSELLN